MCALIDNYLDVELFLFFATCNCYFDAPAELLDHGIHHIFPEGLLYLLILSTPSQYALALVAAESTACAL